MSSVADSVPLDEAVSVEGWVWGAVAHAPTEAVRINVGDGIAFGFVNQNLCTRFFLEPPGVADVIDMFVSQNDAADVPNRNAVGFQRIPQFRLGLLSCYSAVNQRQWIRVNHVESFHSTFHIFSIVKTQ